MSTVFSDTQAERFTNLVREIFKDAYQTELELRDKRIAELEKLNATLAEELDRVRREYAKAN